VSAVTQRVTFPAAGSGPLLEGVQHLAAGSGPFPAAVVCHPHPLMGGTMDNTIVVAVCRVLAARGWAALRFNFRGAGRSAGSFDEGCGETDDVAGAVGFLRAKAEVDASRLAVVGYSFGAGVGLRYAAGENMPRVVRVLDSPTCWVCGAKNPNKFGSPMCPPCKPPETLNW